MTSNFAGMGCALDPLGARSESLMQHHMQCVPERIDEKEFLPMLGSCDMDIAFPKGKDGEDRLTPTITRGRQTQWSKDSWLSRLQRSWRWLPCPEVTTLRRSRSFPRYLPSSKPRVVCCGFSAHSFGRAFGPVLLPLMSWWGAEHG